MAASCPGGRGRGRRVPAADCRPVLPVPSSPGARSFAVKQFHATGWLSAAETMKFLLHDSFAAIIGQLLRIECVSGDMTMGAFSFRGLLRALLLIKMNPAGSPGRRVAGSPGRRVAGSPGRRVAGSPGRRVAGSPGRRVAGSPGRRVAGSPGRRVAGSPGRRVAGSPGRRVAGSPGRRVAGSPGRRVAGSPGRRVAGSPGRRVAGSPGRRVAGSPNLRLRHGTAFAR